MSMRRAIAVWTAWAALVAGVNAVEVRSGTVQVNTLPSHNRCWATVFTNEVQLTWIWPADAADAQLVIEGMNGTLATNFNPFETGFLWRPFASAVPAAEDAYALTLTFRADGGETVVEELTSRLAVIKGAFGTAEMDPVPTSSAWGRIAQNVVIPYSAAWTNVSAGAASASLAITNGALSQTNALADAEGYFGWKIHHNGWGYGAFELSLLFPGTESVWHAELFRMLDGTIMSVR